MHPLTGFQEDLVDGYLCSRILHRHCQRAPAHLARAGRIGREIDLRDVCGAFSIIGIVILYCMQRFGELLVCANLATWLSGTEQ